MIKPRLVLTAGHCVHQGSGGASGFYRRFLFVPAYHEGQAPYQAWNWTWVTTTTFVGEGGGGVAPNQADFAIIEVEDRKFGTEVKKIGEVVGTLGLPDQRPDAQPHQEDRLPGQPRQRPDLHQVDFAAPPRRLRAPCCSGPTWAAARAAARVENFGVQAAGQMGGLQPLPNRVVGVTSYGYISTDPKVQGSSILNQEFLTILNAACQHRAGNC